MSSNDRHARLNDAPPSLQRRHLLTAALSLGVAPWLLFACVPRAGAVVPGREIRRHGNSLQGNGASWGRSRSFRSGWAASGIPALHEGRLSTCITARLTVRRQSDSFDAQWTGVSR